jgi:hypothetical protein
MDKPAEGERHQDQCEPQQSDRDHAGLAKKASTWTPRSVNKISKTSP